MKNQEEKRIGRPPGKNKTEIITVKVTPEEKEIIQKKAIEMGVTVSKYVLLKSAYKEVYLLGEKVVDILDV